MTVPRPDGPKTALVHDWLTGMRGGEKVLEAVAGLFPDAPIFTLFHFPGTVSTALESRRIHTSFLQWAPGVRRHYRRYLPLFPAAVEDFDLSGYDLVISTSHCVAKGVIPAPEAHHICYCHTPMRYAWDQEHAYFPRRRGPLARLRGAVLAALRTWDTAASARVDLFVANSRFVARRIRRFYGRGAEVLAPPVDTSYFAQRDGTRPTGAPAEYALAVSALAPYKRLDLAIRGCRHAGLPLVLIGTGPEEARLRRLAGPETRFLGRVDGPELRRWVQGARCFVQPGVEDFGIAAVEALAAGVPVVALGRGGVTDIVEDGVHGVLYPEEDSPPALAAAIDRMRQIRFNPLDLSSRSELFAPERFVAGFRALVEARRSEVV
jgi:glycosyltransferase involved in cell wall biosynthesis